MSAQAEARAKAEAYLKEAWRECPAFLGTVLTAVDYTLRKWIEPLATLEPDEAVRVRNIYAYFGCRLPE